VSTTPPLVALVSAQVGDEIAACKPEVPLTFVVSDGSAPLRVEDLQRVDIAFMSLDLLGESSGARLSAGLQAFFEQLRAAARLRWLHVCSAGADRPVLAELLARGVRLTTSSGANAQEVSHTALAGFLALARHLPQCVAAQRERRWAPMKGERMPRDIGGQTALVVGLGPIGREIARLLSALGVHVIGVRRSDAPVPGCAEVVPLARIDAVLPRANAVILACPSTPETRGLLDARRLALLPAGAWLVNVARGAVVVEDALVDGLRSGRLGGAFLDVFATEPLPADSPLWDLPNTWVSPHSAGFASGMHTRTLEMFQDNLERFAAQRELRNEVVAPA
jgi:phosphoglycerate dehydrogenase-like enzyme